jgi:hypothetical protein
VPLDYPYEIVKGQTTAASRSRMLPISSDGKLAAGPGEVGGGGGRGGDGGGSGSWSSGVGVAGSPCSGRSRRGDGGKVIPAGWTAF